MMMLLLGEIMTTGPALALAAAAAAVAAVAAAAKDAEGSRSCCTETNNKDSRG
jgi:hypothetical protein